MSRERPSAIDWQSEELLAQLAKSDVGRRALAARERWRVGKLGSRGRRTDRRIAERLARQALAEQGRVGLTASTAADVEAEVWESLHRRAPSAEAIEVVLSAAPDSDARLVILRGDVPEQERAAVARSLSVRFPDLRWEVVIR